MVNPCSEHNSTRSCSSDNSFQKSLKECSHAPKKIEFKFPEGGWECSKCQNYNFKGKKKCHRCKKVKSALDSHGMPAHMRLTAIEKDALREAMQKLSPA